MPATAQIRVYHGVSPGTPSADVTGTTLRFKTADNDVQNTSNPVTRPGSGRAFSWRKMMKMNFTTTPTGTIKNLRIFPSTQPPSGIEMWIKSISTYTAASGSDTSGISSFTNNDTNRLTYQSTNFNAANPVVINSGTVLSNPSTGEGTQNFVLLQAAVLSTYAGTVPGATTAFTLTYRYQET